MIRFIIFLVFSFTALNYTVCQSININEEAGIMHIMDLYKNLNKSKEKLSGWRLQIGATTERRKIENLKYSFSSDFPMIPAKWRYTKPYYKLQAGSFIDKRDAERLLFQIKKKYPSAYTVVVKDITPAEILDSI